MVVMPNGIIKEPDAWYPTRYLIDALIFHKILSGDTARVKGQQFLSRAEKAGKLIPHKMPTYSGRTKRMFREKDIEQVVAAFSVGGKGYWKAEPV